MSAAATMSNPTFGGQTNVQVPPLQVDDLLDFKFPLKTSVREAHIEKWTNPRTGQLYNWQQPPQAPARGRGVDLDQMLDWKFTQGKGLQAPNHVVVQSISAEQAKQNIRDNMWANQKQSAATSSQRATVPAMRMGAVSFPSMAAQMPSAAMTDMYPPNYQVQVPNEAPVVRNLSGSKGMIENYIDQFEVFKN